MTFKITEGDDDVDMQEKLQQTAKTLQLKLEIVTEEQLFLKDHNVAYYKYLYCACLRGQSFIVHNIITQKRISPFIPCVNGKSALMAAIDGKEIQVVESILNKEYISPNH